MAVTSLWPVKGSLGNVIRYARNPEKTTEVSAQEVSALHAVNQVLEYTANDIKTEQCKYVSCLNCNEDTAVQEFIMVKKMYRKMDGRQCYHGYQSFRRDEVTAETAHEIGVKLAKTLWGDRFQVLIATHLNTGHFHNHFVINSVSDIDGKKFYNSHADYRRMREESDRLCMEYGLSVVQGNEGKSRNYAQWRAEQNGMPTVRDIIRRDIDTAVRASVTEDGFIRTMKELGYSFKTRSENGTRLKYPAVKPAGAKGWFRLHKLGDEYHLDRIIDRVYENSSKHFPFPDIAKPSYVRYGKLHGYYKKESIYSIYLRYCMQLKNIKHRAYPAEKVSFLLREDVVRLDKYIRQTQILGKYRINTSDDLIKVKTHLISKADMMISQRNNFRKNMRRTSLTESQQAENIKKEIASLTRQLKVIRKEIISLEDIEQRSVKIAQNLKQHQYEKTKEQTEVDKYESGFRRSRTDSENVTERR